MDLKHQHMATSKSKDRISIREKGMSLQRYIYIYSIRVFVQLIDQLNIFEVARKSGSFTQPNCWHDY